MATIRVNSVRQYDTVCAVYRVKPRIEDITEVSQIGFLVICVNFEGISDYEASSKPTPYKTWLKRPAIQDRLLEMAKERYPIGCTVVDLVHQIERVVAKGDCQIYDGTQLYVPVEKHPSKPSISARVADLSTCEWAKVVKPATPVVPEKGHVPDYARGKTWFDEVTNLSPQEFKDVNRRFKEIVEMAQGPNKNNLLHLPEESNAIEPDSEDFTLLNIKLLDL